MFFVSERRRSMWLPSAIRARDVRAADLRRSRRNASRTELPSQHESFRRMRRRRRLSNEHRNERSEPSNTASLASEAIKPRLARLPNARKEFLRAPPF